MSESSKKIKQTAKNKTSLHLRPELANSDVSLSTEIQEALVQIWQEMLGIESISADDNFFELGGHSILAMKGLTRIKEKFKVEITFKDFMISPTIATQGELIKARFKSIKGTARIKETLEGEMSFNDFMNSPQSATPVESIKARFKSINGTKLLNDIVYSEDVTKFPLTETQKALWYLCKLNNNSPAYNIPITLKLTGKLDRNILRKTIEVIFKRQNIIFATFHSCEGEPFISINLNQNITIQEYELVKLPEKELEKKYNEIISFDSRQAFNLEEGPLFRLHLLKLNDSEWLFHTTIHHLVFDGISWGIFLDEFNSIYDRLIKNEKLDIEDISYHQYDYAKWLKKNPTGENSRSVAFWEKYLDGIPAYTNFPLDRSRTKPPSGKGARLHIKIPSEIAKKIRAYSISQNTTVFITLLSAFSLLIKRFSGENDFCIGTPIANRPHQFLEKIFGLFVDTFALRFNFDEIKTFEDLLGYTKSTVLNVFENRNITFDKVVEIINPERNVLYNSIFQIAFVWPNELSATIKTGELVGERFTIRDGVTPFDITFYMWENNGDIEGEIEYNIDLLNESTIKSLRESYIKLLESIVNNVKENINNLNVVSDNHFNILKEFNITKKPYPQESVTSLLTKICEKLPNKQALGFKGQKVSYSELEKRSNQLALELIRSGVKEGEPVGVFMDKSNDLIISIVSILKVKCYYLPLDTEYPRQRIIDTIIDAGCNYVITSEVLEDTNTGSFKTITVNESIWKNKASSISTFPDSEDFAYIMYTSGTTGKPKGSIIKHKSIVRLIRNTNYISLKENDNILLTGAIGFDATTFEIWGALLNGCTLFIVDKEVLLDPQKLETEINKKYITVLWLTSLLFTQISELNSNVFANLRCLLIGGDVLSVEHVNKIRNLFPALTIINGYGPTENTTFSACHIIQNDYQDNIPIGKPISNSTAYVFNDHLKLQPIGAIGELYVGGDGLSHGYLNRPELNSEKFISNPLNPSEKLFKTGDKARWLADGVIEYYGRIDNQLKIRGFRVEPLEIESQINKIPEIIESVVKPVERLKGNVELYAFLYLQKNSVIRQDDIKSYLKKIVPSYMIPSFYDFRISFPKTINGKVDRKALKFKSEFFESKEDADEFKMNDIERRVFAIFSDAVKHKNFSIESNFFEIGGNSLLSIKVISLIEKKFNITLKVRDFIADFNSVKRIAEHLSEKKDKNKKVNLKSQKLNNDLKHLYPHLLIENSIPIFSVFSDGVFSDFEVFISNTIYNFVWPGSEGRLYEMDSVEEIAQTYLEEILKVYPNGPFYLIGFSFGGLIAYEMALLLQKKGFQVPILILIDSNNPQKKVSRVLRYRQKFKKHGFFNIIRTRLFMAIAGYVKVRIQHIYIYICIKLNKRLSANLTKRMIVDESAKIAKKYQPGYFNGKVCLFRSSESFNNDKFMGWQTHVSEMREIEMEGYHLDMVHQKENKLIIIKELNKIIKEVESTV